MKVFVYSIVGLFLAVVSFSVLADNNTRQKDMPKKHVYIIHGYNASPDAHWFPWLKQKLMAEGVTVTVLAMPNPTSPNSAEWLQYLKTHIQSPDENTFFVAHSLGCITLLRYLNTLSDHTKIGGMILVSGFTTPLSILPQLDAFTKKSIDPKQIINLTAHRVIVASRDDSIVPYQQTEALSRLLKAQLFSIDNGGHFLASDGVTQLPIVLKNAQALVRQHAKNQSLVEQLNTLREKKDL